MMQKIQRFGGAMFVPVLLFPFAGVIVGLAILFKNQEIMGSLADPNNLWYQVWTLIENGGWTIFNQMPLLFAIGIPIGLAKSAHARACMEALITYLTFNYFINSILTLWGDSFGVDFNADVGGVSGLTMIAGIKTLDTSIIGSIVISAIVVALHNRYFDKKLPDYLGIFQGSSFVVIIAFFVMIPVAFITAYFWPMIQSLIQSMQGFLTTSGVVGVWVYTFLERILIPTGLHHFIYSPFVYGPAVVEGGITKAWIENLSAFSASSQPLKELFPAGGFALHGNSKIFAIPGIAAAIYVTAKTKKRKIISGLLISATLTAVLAGITEPIEFTFLFIAPVLFAVHAFLAATMAATMYAFGVVGSMGGGLIETATSNWIPLFNSHGSTFVIQWIIGLSFMVIYFFVFKFLIEKLNLATPGREEDDTETKLYTKADYKEKKAESSGTDNRYKEQAIQFLHALGGAENIEDVTNCATRLRLSVVNPDYIQKDSSFKAAGAHGIVRNGKAIQVIVGLSVPQVREQFEQLLNEQKNAG